MYRRGYEVGYAGVPFDIPGTGAIDDFVAGVEAGLRDAEDEGDFMLRPYPVDFVTTWRKERV